MEAGGGFFKKFLFFIFISLISFFVSAENPTREICFHVDDRINYIDNHMKIKNYGIDGKFMAKLDLEELVRIRKKCKNLGYKTNFDDYILLNMKLK